MKRDELRQKLIDGTIHVIAVDGFDKATTKQVGTYTGINQAYIYRCFKGKEDMFTKTFDMLDNELLNVIVQNLDVMYMTGIDFQIRCKVFYYKLWKFLLSDEEKCLSYIRYYYSTYYNNYSADAHKERFWPVVKTMQPIFKDEADVWMILNHILNVTLDFAIKVHTGRMSPSDDYSEHVFRVIYVSIKQYFRNNEECDS